MFWERWIIPLTFTSSSSSSASTNQQPKTQIERDRIAIERHQKLTQNMIYLVTCINEKKEHIPPNKTNTPVALAFSFEISHATGEKSDETWGLSTLKVSRHTCRIMVGDESICIPVNSRTRIYFCSSRTAHVEAGTADAAQVKPPIHHTCTCSRLTSINHRYHTQTIVKHVIVTDTHARCISNSQLQFSNFRSSDFVFEVEAVFVCFVSTFECTTFPGGRHMS